MDTILSDIETRIIGCLMEKSVVTPEQYPLTLNALTNACNQKSSRDPVMSLEKAQVQHAARQLKSRHLIRIEENFKTGVEKYTQIFCNTLMGDRQLTPAQFSLICLLLLRGPQTPGELRSRSGRLHTFADNQAVADTLATLMAPDAKPYVVKLPRTPGRKDCEYTHLLSGPVDVAAYENAVAERQSDSSTATPSKAVLQERVEALELRMNELERQLSLLTGST